MTINYLAVLVASVAEFIIGGIWYMPIFGKLWGEIHGFNKMTKDQQQAAQKQMPPMLVLQFVFTFVTTVVLAKLIVLLPHYSVYKLALLVWIGFFVPTQVAAVVFGGIDSKWFVKKSMIMAGGSLACLVAAAAILHSF
jgi:uncharacterized protein DUF1761